MNEIKYDDRYFDWLIYESDECFCTEIIGIFEKERNEWILSKIESELKKHLNAAKELLAECNDTESVEEFQELISLASSKLSIFNQMRESYRQKYESDLQLEQEPGSVKLLFARNDFGTIMLERDLQEIKKYADAKYEAILELLKKLLSGDTNFNEEKQKPLTKSKKLKGIYELKDYQVRLLYMREKGYTIVIGALVKKDDNDSRYRDSVINMRTKSEEFRYRVRNGLIDIEQELLASNEIIESLGLNGRNRKNG